MQHPSYNTWPTTLEEAKQVQEELRHQVILEDQFEPLQLVAGVDVGFEDAGDTTRAAVVLLSFPELKPVEQAIARRPTHFPYVPGFLSFREIPAVLEALEQLEQKPQMLLCDGQGIAHPRGMGIASHLGVITGYPTIGVAKSILVGRHAELDNDRGSWQPMLYKGNVVGGALRTRSGFKPVYISPGHKVSLHTALQIVMQCAPKYRLPETTRQAHNLASYKPKK
jgi:deoxyribonuclease V